MIATNAEKRLFTETQDLFNDGTHILQNIARTHELDEKKSPLDFITKFNGVITAMQTFKLDPYFTLSLQVEDEITCIVKTLNPVFPEDITVYISRGAEEIKSSVTYLCEYVPDFKDTLEGLVIRANTIVQNYKAAKS